jgi:hypothetical protein
MWNEVGVGDADAVGIIPRTSTRPRLLVSTLDETIWSPGKA